jgi:hypothetical protein
MAQTKKSVVKKRDADWYAAEVLKYWNQSIQGILNAGLALIEAKSQLEHGEWLKMIGGKLPFGHTTVVRLMQIARDPRLSNIAISQHLPVNWTTLSQLTMVPDAVFDDAIIDGRINATMTGAQAKALLNEPPPTNPSPSPKIPELEPSGVVHGDFRNVAAQLPDDSVDMIFTDPPYDRATVPIYEDMARIARRILRPGASLITYIGHYALFDVGTIMTPYLKFWWPILLHMAGPGKHAQMKHHGVSVHSKPLLWFVKGTHGRSENFVNDYFKQPSAEKDLHPWQQGVDPAKYYIDRICAESGMVFDPFCGSGTTALAARQTGRGWLTCDTDLESVKKARERLSA